MIPKVFNKWYIGVLSDEKSLGIGEDMYSNYFAYIKPLNIEEDNEEDNQIKTVRMFASDYPDKNNIFKNMDKHELAEELSEKIFIFKIERSDLHTPYYNYKAVDIIVRKRPSELSINEKLVGIPCFEKDNLEQSVRNCERLDYNFVDSISDENPMIMTVDEDIHIYFNLSFSIEKNSLFFNKKDDYSVIERYEVSLEKINSIVTFSNGDKNDERIAFIPENIMNIDGLNKISENEVSLDWQSSNQQDNDEKKEYDFIKYFIDIVEKKYALTFSHIDLINFHNSVKSNLLTILAGLSGTGKSKITEVYADALGILNNEQYKMISVRPFWQDDADLLGFVDISNNNYHPGDTELLETLIEANKNKDKLYLVVFDEMNIARIEHYFSQFISVLERSPQNRYITLYNKNLEARLYNSDKYPSKILIPENVRFIGTMNLDESTFQISNRILDRANIIDFKILSFCKKIEKSPSEMERTQNISFDDFKKFLNNDSKLTERELELFDKLHIEIAKNLPGAGLSWRTVNNIQNYINNAPELDNFSHEIALDLQVSSRILPKIRGTEEMICKLVGFGNDNGSIEKILDEFNDLSDFENSREILKQKNREIQINGFAR